MVCTVGRGKMAAMVRLLETGNLPEITTEEATYDKLTAQSIRRELYEADEANLLEEEDMHIFDCQPMADPLHLVCCNACKKPVKASQYAAHAERCKSLNSTEETGLELDGGTGHKKPPRKGRKKLQTAHDNQVTAIAEQERSESIDADDTAASESNVDEQAGMTTSFSKEPKRILASTGRDSGIDGSTVSPRSYSAGVILPSKKRSKLIASGHVLLSNDIQTTYGVTTNVGISCQEAQNRGEFLKGSITSRDKPCESIVGFKLGAPVPLATKMYHSQRNHRLRMALTRLYYNTTTKEHCNDMSPKLVQGNMLQPSPTLSPENEKPEDLPQKEDAFALPTLQKPDQILAQSSELCLGNSGGYPSPKCFSNQFRGSNFSKPAVSVDSTPVGMMRSRYLPASYSFHGTSGTSLGNMQAA